MNLKNLNQVYIIQGKYISDGVEYYIINFPMLTPMAYWTKRVWPDLISKLEILKSGSTAIIIRKKDLYVLDESLDKHRHMFTKTNKWIKGKMMSHQIGLLEKQKGYYPENN